MKLRQYAYLGGAVFAAIAVAISGWNPLLLRCRPIM
jgi:hypothetical protein